MKKLPVLFFATLSVCACNISGMDPIGPFGPGEDHPLPPGTEGSTYEFTTIEYDGLLATDTVYQTLTLSNKITTIGSQAGPGRF